MTTLNNAMPFHETVDEPGIRFFKSDEQSWIGSVSQTPIRGCQARGRDHERQCREGQGGPVASVVDTPSEIVDKFKAAVQLRHY